MSGRPDILTAVPMADGQRRVSEIAEAAAFFLALLAYLWLLAIPFPWLGALVLLAVGISWRRRSLTLKSLGLGWEEFRASGRRWGAIWIFSVSLFLILGHRRLFSFAALAHGVVNFAWGAVQQAVYQSMTYLPLRDNLKSRRLAAGLGGVAFSIMHVPNPVLVPATYVWGVASSLLFERCRSVWGLALLQTMLSSTLFWITPRELNRDFRIGPYYHEAPAPARPAGALLPDDADESLVLIPDIIVARDRAKTLLQALADQNAIERIGVMGRQGIETADVGVLDRENAHAGLADVTAPPGRWAEWIQRGGWSCR